MGLTKQQMQMVTVLVIGAFLVVLNQTLLTPALPTIMDHLNVGATTVQWLTSGYSLVEAVVIPLNAYFLGRFATRRIFLGGMGLFAVGSALCATAPSFTFLMIGRICQACATGVVMPSVFALVLLVFPKERRGSAMGIIGLIVSFAPAVGPSLSGVLVDSIGWRALFVTVVILAAAILVMGFFMMRNFEGFARTSFDGLSVVLLALGMMAMLYGLSTFTSSALPALSVALMVAGAGVLALFARRQMRLDVPVLKVSVLKNRQFRIASLIIIVLEAVLIGSGVIVPMYLQNALGDTATMSGLIMFPGAALGAFCGLLAGRIFDARGVRGVAVTGAIVLLVGGAGYATFSPSTPVLVICLVYTIACLGVQCLITPLNTWGFNALPNDEIPHGNAIVSTFEQIGASFGTAFVVSLTAVPALLGAGGATEAEQAAAGCHAAFFGVLALIAVIAAGIIAFVRDAKLERRPAELEPPDEIPGIDRPWYVCDVMSAEPDTLTPASTVREAIDLMQRRETSGLPIVDVEGAVRGFLSDGDILKRLSRNDLSRLEGDSYLVLLQTESVKQRLLAMLDVPALELATRRVISVDADENAEVAFRMLSERRIKKMPVVRDGRFVGTLSRGNIMGALAVLEQTER